MRSLAACLGLMGFLAGNPGIANVRMPALIGDHMVLQRDAKIVLWGWADPGEHVQIEFHGRVNEARTERSGRWSTIVGPFPAGGPFELIVTGNIRLVIHDVLIGDVWLATGQSNLEYPLQGTAALNGLDHAEQEVAGADFPQIRLLRVDHTVALMPETHVDADAWTAVTPTAVASFSAVGYFFGRELHQRYQVPIGLIESSWDGTVAEAWVSAASLGGFPEFRASIESSKNLAAAAIDDPRAADQTPTDPNYPTLLFSTG